MARGFAWAIRRDDGSFGWFAVAALVLGATACGTSTRNGSEAAGGGGSVDASGGGGGAADVEYRTCANDAQAIPRTAVFRADRTHGACAVLMLEGDGASSCLLLASGAWCLYQAHLGSDVDACLRGAFPMPSSPAISATGTFTVSSGSLDLALSLVFAGSNDTVEFEVEGCSTACSMTDCR